MEWRILILFAGIFFLFTSCEREVFMSESENESLSTYLENGELEYKNANLLPSFKNFDTILHILSDKNIGDRVSQNMQLQAFCYQGMIYEKLGNNEKAYEKYSTCRDHAEFYEIHDYEIVATVNLIYLAENDIDEEKLLQDSFQKFSITKNNEYSFNQLLHKQALFEAKQGNFSKAKLMASKMLKSPVYDDNINANTKGNLYKLLGEIYSYESKFDSALLNYEIAIELLENYNLESAEVYLLIAKNHLSQKNYSVAESTLKKISLLIGSDDILLKKELNELYLELHNANGSAEKGLYTLSILRKIDNFLNDENKKIQGYISNRLKNQNLKASNKLQLARIKYISILAILSLLLFSLFHLYKQARNKEEKLELEVDREKLQVKNKALEVKNKELELKTVNRVIDAKEEKEKEFAEVLHDKIGANLSAINMHLSTLSRDVPEEKITGISGLLKTTIKETRDLSHLLEPPALKAEGIIASITEKAEEFAYDKFAIEVNSEIEYIQLNSKVARSIYNAILEFISNTIKHAEATKMQIEFSMPGEETLAVNISDNGKGFDADKIHQSTKGLGLNGIRSRINYFGGTFNIQSSNRGTTINLTVPAKAALKQSA